MPSRAAKRKARVRTDPPWTTTLTEGGRARMRALFAESFARHAPRISLTPTPDGEGFIVNSEPGTVILGLSELTRTLRDRHLDAWPAIVDEHVGALAGTFTRAPFEALDMSWSEARDLLRLRVKARHGLEGSLEAHFVTLALNDDLYAMASLDLPTMITGVSPGHAEAWGISEEEILAIGRANLAREASPVDKDVALEGVTAHEISGGFWAASQVLRLDAWIHSPDGALVIVPKRDLLVFAEIAGPEILQAPTALLEVAVAAYQDGPYSIVPFLQWWHEGVLVPMTAHDATRLWVAPPPELLAIFEGLLGTALESLVATELANLPMTGYQA